MAVNVSNTPAAGAPTDADYVVGTSNANLSAEIVAGTAPAGELGGTWAAPTVDATHSGSSHANLPAGAQVNAVDIATISGTQTLTNKSIAETQITFTDITTGNASATAHGFVPKWPNNTTTFFRGDGTFAAVPASGAPATATYITQTPDAGLSAEQALSVLSTGLVNVTTTTGVLGSVAAPTGAVVGTSDAQTLTNKTLTSPVINTGVTGTGIGASAGLVAAGDHTTPAMTATVAGHVPTPPNNTTTFLRGDGTFAAPAVKKGVVFAEPWNRGGTNPADEVGIGDFPVAALVNSVTDQAKFAFPIPSDFVALSKAVVVLIPNATGNLYRSVATDWGAAGEAYSLNSDSIAASTVALTNGDIKEDDVTAALTGIAAGDYIGMIYERQAANASDTAEGDVYVVGLLIEYT